MHSSLEIQVLFQTTAFKPIFKGKKILVSGLPKLLAPIRRVNLLYFEVCCIFNVFCSHLPNNSHYSCIILWSRWLFLTTSWKLDRDGELFTERPRKSLELLRKTLGLGKKFIVTRKSWHSSDWCGGLSLSEKPGPRPALSGCGLWTKLWPSWSLLPSLFSFNENMRNPFRHLYTTNLMPLRFLINSHKLMWLHLGHN